MNWKSEMVPEIAMPKDLKRSYMFAQKRVIADVQEKILLLESLYSIASQKPRSETAYSLAQKQAASFLDLYIFKRRWF
jgi:hypothetical protein